ncbi:manganese efflux pump MntP [Thermostilla marina]
MLALAVALAMDALAVSVAVGLRLGEITSRHVFRIAFHFGLFQALMPIIGWSVGSSMASRLEAVDHWIAFALLVGIGGKMFWESRSDDEPEDTADPTRGWSLVVLSIATSIDALAVGFTLALLNESVWVPAVVIGLVAAGLSWAGIGFGARIGRRWSRVADLAGGTILILIGTRILLSHLAA